MKVVYDSTLAATTMLSYWDRDLICRLASKAYLQWMGIHPDEIIDKMHVSEILGPAYKQVISYFQTAAKNESYVAVGSATLSDGRNANFRIVFSPDVVDGAVLGFYAHIIENTESGIAEDGKQIIKLPKYLGASNDGFLNDIIRTLKDCVLTEFPGITAIAKKHFISESKLKRDFKKRYQCSVFSFYRRLQMELAEQYLRNKKYNKNQLALMFNFSNPSNFSACYGRFLKEKSSRQTIVDIRKENDQRYKTFIEQSPVATAMLDSQLFFIAVSQKWTSDYALDGTNMIGRSVFSVIPKTANYFRDMYERSLQGERCRGEQMFVEKNDDPPQWLQWDITPWFTDYGTVGGIIIHAEDITRLKLKEQENERTFEILRKAADISRLGTWTRNFRTHQIEWNEMVKEVLEVSPDFKPDKHPILHFYRKGESRSLIEESLRQALHNGEEFDIEVELISAKGNLKRLRVIGYTEFYNGKCEKLIVLFQDLTHRQFKLKAIPCN